MSNSIFHQIHISEGIILAVILVTAVLLATFFLRKNYILRQKILILLLSFVLSELFLENIFFGNSYSDDFGGIAEMFLFNGALIVLFIFILSASIYIRKRHNINLRNNKTVIFLLAVGLLLSVAHTVVRISINNLNKHYIITSIEKDFSSSSFVNEDSFISLNRSKPGFKLTEDTGLVVRFSQKVESDCCVNTRIVINIIENQEVSPKLSSYNSQTGFKIYDNHCAWIVEGDIDGHLRERSEIKMFVGKCSPIPDTILDSARIRCENNTYVIKSRIEECIQGWVKIL